MGFIFGFNLFMILITHGFVRKNPMLIPSYWAEYHLPVRRHRKNTYIHRFGWSNDSQEAALYHAKERCEAAVLALQDSPSVKGRDVLDSYLGSEQGLPIKEQILARFDNAILTVNGYGASCINVPDVMILDVDHDDILNHLASLKTYKKPKDTPLYGVVAMAVLICILLGQFIHPLKAMVLLIPIFVSLIWVVDWLDEERIWHWEREVVQKIGGFEQFISEKLSAFAKTHDMSFRLYATPDGFRIIATDRHYLPSETQTLRCFDELLVDSRYANLCKVQQCFLARVTGKPWRMDMGQMGRLPSKKFWQDDEATALRQAWLAEYHTLTSRYRACRFVASFGISQNPDIMSFVALHDKLCQCELDVMMA